MDSSTIFLIITLSIIFIVGLISLSCFLVVIPKIDYKINHNIDIPIDYDINDVNKFPIYIINLDRSVDRWNKIKNSFEQQNIYINRFPAVEGKNLNLNELVKNKLITKDLILNQKRPIKRILYASNGAIGCALSHKSVWDLCIKLNKPIMVFEDDITLKPDFMFNLKKYIQYVPQDRDIVYLSISGYNILKYIKKSINKHCFQTMVYHAMAGYIIYPRGAKKLLNIFPITYQFDFHISDAITYEKVKSYIIYPQIINHRVISSDSSIQIYGKNK